MVIPSSLQSIIVLLFSLGLLAAPIFGNQNYGNGNSLGLPVGTSSTLSNTQEPLYWIKSPAQLVEPIKRFAHTNLDQCTFKVLDDAAERYINHRFLSVPKFIQPVIRRYVKNQVVSSMNEFCETRFNCNSESKTGLEKYEKSSEQLDNFSHKWTNEHGHEFIGPLAEKLHDTMASTVFHGVDSFCKLRYRVARENLRLEQENEHNYQCRDEEFCPKTLSEILWHMLEIGVSEAEDNWYPDAF